MTSPHRYISQQDIGALHAARREYEALGFTTIPLIPGTKVTKNKGWPSRESEDMWRDQSSDSNVGIRMGGDLHLAVIDCDEKSLPGTFEMVSLFLLGMGYKPGDYPLVQTASETGRHIYLRLDGSLEKQIYFLAEEFGAGELRVGPGAYVVATPSMVGGVKYTLLSGHFDTIPVVPVSILLPLIRTLDHTLAQPKWPITSADDPKIPRLAQELLAGNSFPRYRSRSEHEYALILCLINAGFTRDEILELLKTHPGPGKFQEMYQSEPDAAIVYFNRSYEQALQYSTANESPGRTVARLAIEGAGSLPWRGRTGSSDRAVFLAHASIAFDAGRITYAASSRELAERANMTHRTASRATNRLIKRGLLRRTHPSHGEKAAEYTLERKE